MEILLEKDLKHQKIAVDKIGMVLGGVDIKNATEYYSNPVFDVHNYNIEKNIRIIQDDKENFIPLEYRNKKIIDDILTFDIKMETGTGKTYVYTKSIFELNKLYGFNKFIIAVPTLAIKSGTKMFLNDSYVIKHFKDACGYNKEIEVYTLESRKNKKKGKKFFPSEIREFINNNAKNKIQVLLINMGLLKTGINDMLYRDDYDYAPFGYARPYDAIKSTKPILIVDEPHRFSRKNKKDGDLGKTWSVIINELKPQFILRFGATFPEIEEGKGQNKKKVKDYQNLLYDLNACVAFNEGLIKGVAKEHLESPSKKNEKIKILSINNKQDVRIEYIKENKANKTFDMKVGDSLSIITPDFNDLTISGISKNTVKFSNSEDERNIGEELDVNIYTTSYQEEMLRLALMRHFDIEFENFCNRRYKIKTLALFFIDDINSYRLNPDGKKPYLKISFEKILKEIVERKIKELEEKNSVYYDEYIKYLHATLDNIETSHAGYFSKDNNDSDENIKNEIDIILNGKKKLLSFKYEDGSYNTLRFLFSKWTLKEGWDNPNVFTIAKLRSSGSEISKLQEVGRGLRLPVDENGNRISNEKFYLNYIVDFTEKDFAEKLVKEINKDNIYSYILSDEKLKDVAEKLELDPNVLFGMLLSKSYIDRNYNIIEENKNKFFEEYPEFESGLKSDRIKNKNKKADDKIKIRKNVYNELRTLWEKINQRYLIFFDKDIEKRIQYIVDSIFEEKEIFKKQVVVSERQLVKSTKDGLEIETGIGEQFFINKQVPYNEFLKKITIATNIPIIVINKSIISYADKVGNIDKECFNEQAIQNFILEFNNWKINELQGMFHYEKANFEILETKLTDVKGEVKTEIVQGLIGTKIEPGEPTQKYLYDKICYDSPLEKENIISDISEVTVYGKIPRNSISIPTIFGGKYSPDFMYVIKRNNGKKEINLIVETKDVENKTDLRDVERMKINCAEVFFENLSKEGYKVEFKPQINNTKIISIINDIVENEKGAP